MKEGFPVCPSFFLNKYVYLQRRIQSAHIDSVWFPSFYTATHSLHPLQAEPHRGGDVK